MKILKNQINNIKKFAFIIGAMKCGTSGLFEYLSEHPQVAPCSRKEPNFFSSDSTWDEGWDWYQNLWNWDSNIHKVAIEASVDYSKLHIFPKVTQRIADVQKKYNLNCKFIYIIRNPLDRIESHYIHGLAQGWKVSKQPLSKNIEPHLIETSKYAKQIDSYYEIFPSDDILLLNFEDLKQNRQKTLGKICQFIDIDFNYQFQGLNTIYNSKKGRKADSPLWLALSQIKTLRSLGKIFSHEQRQAIRQFLSYEIKSDFKLSEEQKNFILQELQNDLKKLNCKYGFDISRWNI